MLIFKKFFLRVKNLYSRELDGVFMGISALGIWIPGKKLRWALHRAGYCVQTSSNIFVPSTHTEGKSPSQVPAKTCGPRELVKPATYSNIDGRLLSLGLYHTACLPMTDGYRRPFVVIRAVSHCMSSNDGWLLEMCRSQNYDSISHSHPLFCIFDHVRVC